MKPAAVTELTLLPEAIRTLRAHTSPSSPAAYISASPDKEIADTLPVAESRKYPEKSPCQTTFPPAKGSRSDPDTPTSRTEPDPTADIVAPPPPPLTRIGTDASL